MKAMVLKKTVLLADELSPLVLEEVPDPVPGHGEVVIEVAACGVCHTELDEIEGRTPPPVLPVIVGHQVVGRVVGKGPGAARFSPGDRVGVGWIFSACGHCDYCRSERENLCADFRATGRDVNGGYARFMAVPESFAFPLPDIFSDVEAAPLLCAGAIGYRSLRLSGTKDGDALGLTGFGASAHMVLAMVRHRFPRTSVFVFARNREEQAFALERGAVWAGDTMDEPPEKLGAIIDTTPAWGPVAEALRHLVPGGRLVINAIRKENADKEALLRMQYETHLWHEKEVKSVANVTRRDIAEFLAWAAAIPLVPAIETYSLEDANRALAELRQRRIRGAKVLKITGHNS